MQLRHEFEVEADVDEAWKVLTDMERMARLVPGAEMSERVGDEYRGSMSVQVGPISALYRGAAQFEELDAENHRAVLSAGGRDKGGNGNVRVVVSATLEPIDGGGTRVILDTELNLTGKVLRLGPEVITPAGDELFRRFVEEVHGSALPAPSAVAADEESSGAQANDEEEVAAADAAAHRVAAHAAEPIDVSGGNDRTITVGGPAILGAIAFLVLVEVLRRRRRRAAGGEGSSD